MPRLPSSLKWLIDRRARVAGEILKMEASLTKCQALAADIRQLQDLLASVDETLSLHDVSVDVSLIKPVKRQGVRINMPHGELTRSILLFLKINPGLASSTDEITKFVAARFVALEGEISSVRELRESVRYRLKGLHRNGVINRHNRNPGAAGTLWSISNTNSDSN